MLKVMMKEPVTSGFNASGTPFQRGGNYILCMGEITNSFKEEVSLAIQQNGCISMMEKGNNPILIPARNIAWIQVAPDTDFSS